MTMVIGQFITVIMMVKLWVLIRVKNKIIKLDQNGNKIKEQQMSN